MSCDMKCDPWCKECGTCRSCGLRVCSESCAYFHECGKECTEPDCEAKDE